MGSDSVLTPEQAKAALRECACFNLRRASRAVTRLFDEALAASGLRSTQFVVLVAIQARERVPVQALARDLGVERSALLRRIDPLERDGFVRSTTTRGGGSSYVELTAKGRKKTAEAATLWHGVQTRFVESLGGAGQWTALRTGLGAVPPAADEA